MPDSSGKTVFQGPDPELLHDLTGQTLGRFQILNPEKGGGMGMVYKAQDTRLGNHVAFKVIRTDKLAPAVAARSVKRFEREARTLAQLAHPSIVRVLDYGEENGLPYLVMEYLTGGTLKERLDGKPMTWQQAIRLAQPIAAALEYAHQHGVVHRDVKPSNILFNSAGQPVLTDFGIVRILDDEGTQDQSTTSRMLGTPEYMSPEQALGNAFDHRVDIYALGVVLYEMLTGRRPFLADTPVGVLVKHASEPLPRPTQLNPGLPAGVEQFLLRSLAKNPAQRFQSAAEMLRAMETLLQNGGQAGGGGGGPSPNPNNWLLLFGLGGGGLVLVGAVIALILFGQAWFNPGTASPAPATNTPRPAPSATRASPTRTSEPLIVIAPAATATSRPQASTCSLAMCSSSNAAVCLYSFSSEAARLGILFKYQNGQAPASMPRVTAAGKSFTCTSVPNYPDRVYCYYGQSLSGSTQVSLVSAAGDLSCSGTFSIPKYVAPSPTPRGGGGNTYP